MKRYNIAQVGTFDVENYGDLLFPIVFDHEMRKRLPIDNIYLFSPNKMKMPFYGYDVHATSELDSFCSSHKVDAIIIGGGDIVRIGQKIVPEHPESFIPSFSLWQYPIIVANKHNIPVLFNCPGVPTSFDIYQPVVDKMLDLVPYISVRDSNAKKSLVDTSNTKVSVILDSVNLIANKYPKESLIDLFLELKKKYSIEDKFIVVQSNKTRINDQEYIDSIVKLVNLINDKYDLQVVFSPIGYVHNDLDILRPIHEKCSDRNVIIEEKMNPEQMLSLFSNSAGFVGTSLHGIVTSNAYRVPVLAIDSSGFNKISGFLELCGMSDRFVEDMSELSTVFEKVFFSKISYSKFEKELGRLSNHFDMLSKMISDQTLNSCPDGLCDIIDEFYKLSCHNPSDICANFLYEKRSLMRTIRKDDSGHYHLANYDHASTVLISFLDKPIVSIEKIKIVTNTGKALKDYSIHNGVLANGKQIYINPVIKIENVSSYDYVDVQIDYSDIDHSFVIDALNKRQSSLKAKASKIIHGVFPPKTH